MRASRLPLAIPFLFWCVLFWSTAASAQVYRDVNKPVDERVADLVSRMTLEEKVSQMMNDSPAIERLGVPAYDWWNECLHGVARAGRATVFPETIGMAATWDTGPDLPRRHGNFRRSARQAS